MIDLIIVPIAMEIFEKKRILFLLFPLMEKKQKDHGQMNGSAHLSGQRT
jgi:hypothetical protein